MFKIDAQRLSIFKNVYPFIKKEKHLYFILGGLKIWTLLLSLIGPMLYMVLINNVMIGKKLELLLPVLLGYIGIYLLQTLGTVMNKRVYNKLFLKFNVRIKTRILEIFTKMNVAQYASYKTGDLKNRIDADISVVEGFFNTHILNFFYALISAVVIGFILLSMNWLLALTSFVMVPVSFWFVKIMGKRAQTVSEKQRELQGEYESFLHGSFQNWRQIKSNNLEQNRDQVFQNYRQGLSRLFVKNQIYWFINRGFIAFKDLFITKMNLYFIGGLLIIRGQMNVGVLLAFMSYYAQFFGNISSITDSVLGLKNDAPSIERVLQIINTDLPEKPQLRNLRDDIHIRNLSFRYYAGQPLVLNHIDLSIAPNEHIAVVGRSGSGKTTFAKLLIGLYQPLEGTVCLGDSDINQIGFESVSRKIGIVLQEPPLFNLTIRENLQLAKKHARDEEFIIACQKANIFDFIDGLPDKFDTVIGERGVKLSGGQKQRLSIARTLLQNPDIIIFDEATSSLDSENEKAIVSAIAELSKGKTVITIAHRLSTILGCSRVVVLDKGKISAVGTHKALRGRSEIYDLLFEKQYTLS